ncbi:MAG: NHL repeat-containing protein, partial [Candidatus Binatia bacterium]
MNVRTRAALCAATFYFALGGPLYAEIGDLVADGVVGHSSLSDVGGLQFGPATFAKPRGLAIDRGVVPNRVYVSDTEYHRVLGWADADALSAGAPADIVIGQADMMSFGCNRQAFDAGITPPATLSSLCQPTGLAVDDGGRLYVADSRNCRVLVFDDPFGTDQVADHVLGSTGQCSGVTVNATDMYDPEGVAVDGTGNVFVADTLHCRVLEFDGPVDSADAIADRVYGQGSFTASFCQSVYFPRSVAVDPSGTLWVGSGSRVYQFDDALAGSAATPTRSLGSVNCNDGGESASSTCGPAAVATDAAGRLYVGDAGNSRVLAFDAPHGIFQAGRVYGQPTFLGST